MSLFREKLQEVGMSMLPILVIVVILNFTLVPLPRQVFFAFLLGAVFVFVGLAIFLLGADLGIGLMGEHMGVTLARTNKFKLVLFVGAILGLLITIAEPDLHILGAQIQNATSGALSSSTIVLVVSTGVSIMLAVALATSIRRWPLKFVFLLFYGMILILSFFVPSALFAMSFDASGATTGALTVPFLLTFGMGIANTLHSRASLDHSDVFGFVGICSIGPIIAVMLMSIISGQEELTASDVATTLPNNLFAELLQELTHMIGEAFIAVVPLVIAYLLYQWIIAKAPRRKNRRIIIGLFYTYLGLLLFLTGVNIGFMNVGLYIGQGIANYHSFPLFIGVSFVLGLVVILAEPAVHVLADQVQDVTAGAIRKTYILLSLSIGVGTAVALSALRIWFPGLQLWHILLPGFGLALLMSFKSKQSIVGMAFDSGGVASGPMAATFILAYAQGAAAAIPTADVLADGFGIIALIAMTPIIALQVMGLVYERKTKKGDLAHD